MRRAFQFALLWLCLATAWGLPTERATPVPQPTWTFTVGPGTIIAVRPLDVPFVGRSYVVRYKTERGELIEIRDRRQRIPVLQGMHGLLTYSTNPEMILNFKVVESKVAP